MAIYLFSVWLILEKGEMHDWLDATWDFAKLIIPLLFMGVMIAGALLGRPGQEAWVPSRWIEVAVGGKQRFGPNFFAAISGLSCILPLSLRFQSYKGLVRAAYG